MLPLHLLQLLPTTKLMVADLRVDPGVGILPLPDVIFIKILVPGAAEVTTGTAIIVSSVTSRDYSAHGQ